MLSLRQKIADKLVVLKVGEVLADSKSLRRFARDQSIYQVSPLAVIFPEDLEAVRKIISFAAEAGLPLTTRGGGSGTAGSALGEGLVIATRRGGFLSRIGKMKTERRGPLTVVEAGVYHADLQASLKKAGFFLPADPSSSKICKIGGNIATKASGPHALKYGSISDFLVDLQFITARGEFVSTARPDSIPSRIKEGLLILQKEIADDRQASSFLQQRRGMKTASGYNMQALLKDLPIAELVAQLFAGSVGSLGFISGATLRAVPYCPERGAMLLYFKSMAAACEVVAALMEHDVAAIEVVSRQTLRVVGKRSTTGPKILTDHHMLLIEVEGSGAVDKLKDLQGVLKGGEFAMAHEPEVASDPVEIEALWRMRRQILPVLSRPGGALRALPVVNDVGVPPTVLPAFIKDIQTVFDRYGLESIIYGHAGSGNLHLRPLFDCHRKDLRSQIKKLADEVYGVVLAYGGTITAEHGMGRLRAPYLCREWGAGLYGYMKKIKAIFDPDELFNPQAMFGDQKITDNWRDDL